MQLTINTAQNSRIKTPSSESSWQELRQEQLAKASACQRGCTSSDEDAGSVSSQRVPQRRRQRPTAARWRQNNRSRRRTPASTTASNGDATKTPRRTGDDDGKRPVPDVGHGQIVAQRLTRQRSSPTLQKSIPDLFACQTYALYSIIRPLNRLTWRYKV